MLYAPFLEFYGVIAQKGVITKVLKKDDYHLAPLKEEYEEDEIETPKLGSKPTPTSHSYFKIILGVVVVILVFFGIIKLKASDSSFAAQTLNELFIFIAGFFNQNRGYSAPS